MQCIWRSAIIPFFVVGIYNFMIYWGLGLNWDLWIFGMLGFMTLWCAEIYALVGIYVMFWWCVKIYGLIGIYDLIEI